MCDIIMEVGAKIGTPAKSTTEEKETLLRRIGRSSKSPEQRKMLRTKLKNLNRTPHMTPDVHEKNKEIKKQIRPEKTKKPKINGFYQDNFIKNNPDKFENSYGGTSAKGKWQV